MVATKHSEPFATSASRAEEQFVQKSLRHLAELQRAPSATGEKKIPFPDGWFDIPERQLADLGAMYFLTSMSPFHRGRSIAESIAALEPPLRLGQYRLFRSQGHPRAFMTWAGLDDAAEWQFAVDHQPLRPEQWNTGSSKWVIDLIAPFGHIDQVLRMLSKTEQTNRVRTLWHNRKGTRARVIEWARDTLDGDLQVSSYGQHQFARRLKGE